VIETAETSDLPKQKQQHAAGSDASRKSDRPAVASLIKDPLIALEFAIVGQLPPDPSDLPG
jgi:hypothetical protein